MPITSFTIGGVEVNPRYDTFDIHETSGGVSTLVCDVSSIGSPVLRFDLFAAIVVKEDDITIFAGTVTQTLEHGDGGPNIYDDTTDAPQIITTITAEDYNRLAERVYVTEDVADGTSLKTFLTTLVGYLSSYSVTLDASQVDGPALPALTFERTLLSSVLQSLADATGYLSRIDYDKQLRMWAPGDLAAPFDIDEFDSPAKWTGDVQVEQILGDDYANHVTVVTGLIDEKNHVETFTGDGSTYSFPLTYTLYDMRYKVIVNGAEELLTFQGIGFDLAVQWLYYAADNTIRRETTGVADPPANGAAISITFDGTFETSAVAQDAAEIATHGKVEYVEPPRSDIRSTEAAQAVADQILAAKKIAGDHIVHYDTRWTAPTLHAGQEQTLTATARNVAGAHLITDLRVRAETPVTEDFAATGLGLIRTVTATRSQTLEHKFQNTYRDWLGGGNRAAGTTTTMGSGTTPPVGVAPPNRAVQYNQNGQFGGDAAFIYYEDENSIVCGGGGSSITAASFESCGVFGDNCHITDP